MGSDLGFRLGVVALGLITVALAIAMLLPK